MQPKPKQKPDMNFLLRSPKYNKAFDDYNEMYTISFIDLYKLMLKIIIIIMSYRLSMEYIEGGKKEDKTKVAIRLILICLFYAFLKWLKGRLNINNLKIITALVILYPIFVNE